MQRLSVISSMQTLSSKTLTSIRDKWYCLSDKIKARLINWMSGIWITHSEVRHGQGDDVVVGENLKGVVGEHAEDDQDVPHHSDSHETAQH